jgi:hypothetical protein
MLARVIALQAQIRVAVEAVAEARVVLARVVDDLLAGGEELVLIGGVRAAVAHLPPI